MSDRLANAGGGIEAAEGDHVELTFTPLAGTTVVRLRYWRSVGKLAEANWQPYIGLGTGATILDTCEFDGNSACGVGADDWFPNDPNPNLDRSAYREVNGLSTSGIVVGLRCRHNEDHVCGEGSSYTRATAAIFSAFLTIADTTAPSTGTPSGSGWTTTEWSQGTLPLSLTSSDLTGIYATRVYADGSLIASLPGSCVYNKPRPCTDETTGTVNLPTASLVDGQHAIEVAAVDAAGNETRRSRPQPLKVDNQAPSAPTGLTAPSTTSSSNAFDVSWSLPADAGSPLTTARYQLCQAANCGPVKTAPSLTAINGLALPSANTYTLHVWIVDQLGHEDPVGGATLDLTYAPAQPPPLPQPQPLPTPTLEPTPQPTPIPPPDKATAELKLTTLRRSGRRVTVAGSLTPSATGHVTIRYRVRQGRRTRIVTKHAAIQRGAYRLTFTLSPTIARSRSATVTVIYRGNDDAVSETRSRTLVSHSGHPTRRSS